MNPEPHTPNSVVITNVRDSKGTMLRVVRLTDDGGGEDRCLLDRLGAAAPKGVVVAEGRRRLAPTQRPPILSYHPGSQRLRLIPSAEGKRPSAPVTAGDPAVAKTGVVAHGALDISSSQGMIK